MRRIIITGLFAAVLAAFAAAAAPALAHEFVGSQIKGIIQDKNLGNQIFESGLTTLECNEEASKGATQAKHMGAFTEEVEYHKCTFLSLPAEASQVKYEFKAEGTVTFKNELTFKIPKEGCEIKIPSTGNENLGSITYTNNQQSGSIELKAALTGITSTFSGTGTLCPKGSTKTGKYKGSAQLWFFGCLREPLNRGQYLDSTCRFFDTFHLSGYELYPRPWYWGP